MSFPESFVAPWIAIAVFGFTGSLHCAGMCGPLAAAACHNRSGHSDWWKYHFSRIAVYAVLGFVAGLLGSLVFRQGIALSSRTLAVTLGSVMVLYASIELCRAVLAFYRHTGFQPTSVYLKEKSRSIPAFAILRRRLALPQLTSRLGLSEATSFGIMTGLLPCGFLYAALAQATLLSNPLASSLAMTVFAVATAPSLFLGSLGGRLIGYLSPRYSSLALSGVLLAASLAVLYRGAALPHDHSDSHQSHHDMTHSQ